LLTQITEMCHLKWGSLLKYRQEGRFKLRDNKKEDSYAAVQCSWGLLRVNLLLAKAALSSCC